MRPDPVLWYCWRCEQATYWKRRQCQRCLQVRQARIRGYLIALICVVAFTWSVIKLYWGSR